MQLRIFHRNFSRTAKDCTRTGKNLRNFRKLGKSLAVLGILELSCQGLGILELSWQGLKSTGVSVRVPLLLQRLVLTKARSKTNLISLFYLSVETTSQSFQIAKNRWNKIKIFMNKCNTVPKTPMGTGSSILV